MEYIYAFIVLAVFSGIFILTYVLNKRTAKPEGCKELPSECEGCKVEYCAFKNSIEKKETEK